MTVADFAEKYELSVRSIYIRRHVGTMGKNLFKEKDNLLCVDEKAILKRTAFRRKVWLESHERFYFLTKHLSTLELCTLLAKIEGDATRQKIYQWNTWIAVDLFSIQDNSIVNYRVNDKAWKFYRYTGWIIQMLFRTAKIPTNKRKLDKLIERGYEK